MITVVDDSTRAGVRRRDLRVDGPREAIPTALWTPATDGEGAARGLVLLGHGGSGSRMQDYVRSAARGLVLRHGLAAAAIDGPVHGARLAGGDEGPRAFASFAAAWSSDQALTDNMVSDWQASLDALLELEGISGPIGYWGVSMGTIFGLPLVAAERRISAALLGLMGLTGPTRDRIEADAPRVTCPVLFLLQWDDELFARQAGFELFGLLGSSDKTLHANPGTHGAVPDHEFAGGLAWMAERLGAASDHHADGA